MALLAARGTDVVRFALQALEVVQNPLDAANLLNLLDLVTDDAPATA